MPYGDVNISRRLAGNFDPADVTDAEIQTIIAFSDALVDSETAKVGIGWSAIDSSYPLVQNASNYFTAAEIISRYHDDIGKSDAHYEKAMDICMSIRESSPGSLILANSAYTTFPKNPDALIYRSLPGAGSTEREPFGDSGHG